MSLQTLFRKWWISAQRQRMIRQEMDAFAKISPELYSDIGLFPHSFRDEAERLVDCRLRIQCGQYVRRSECPTVCSSVSG